MANAFESAPLSSRNDFGSLIDFLECKVGAEIGVHEGEFSELLLKTSNLELLYSIDAWRKLPKEEYRDICNVAEAEQLRIYFRAAERLRSHGTRSCVLRLGSLEASALFADGLLDFVYIDANHRYEAVMSDLKAWFPKVRSGGLVSGHDFLDGSAHESEFGVRSAVEEFFGNLGLPFAVTEESTCPSWYAVKP